MGPWGPVGAASATPAGNQPGTDAAAGPDGLGVFTEFAPLYRALAQAGVAPSLADELEVWQVAAVLGIERGAATSEPAEPELTGDALLRERMRRHRLGLPPLTTRQGPTGDAAFRGLVGIGSARTGQVVELSEAG